MDLGVKLLIRQFLGYNCTISYNLFLYDCIFFISGRYGNGATMAIWLYIFYFQSLWKRWNNGQMTVSFFISGRYGWPRTTVSFFISGCYGIGKTMARRLYPFFIPVVMGTAQQMGRWLYLFFVQLLWMAMTVSFFSNTSDPHNKIGKTKFSPCIPQWQIRPFISPDPHQ